jgi:hypothetical protein
MLLACAFFGLAGGAISNLIFRVDVTAQKPSIVTADQVIAKSVTADTFLLGTGPIKNASLEMKAGAPELKLSVNLADESLVLNERGLSWRDRSGGSISLGKIGIDDKEGPRITIQNGPKMIVYEPK